MNFFPARRLSPSLRRFRDHFQRRQAHPRRRAPQGFRQNLFGNPAAAWAERIFPMASLSSPFLNLTEGASEPPTPAGMSTVRSRCAPASSVSSQVRNPFSDWSQVSSSRSQTLGRPAKPTFPSTNRKNQTQKPLTSREASCHSYRKIFAPPPPTNSGRIPNCHYSNPCMLMIQLSAGQLRQLGCR